MGFQDTYFVAFNIMGCFAVVAVFLASQISEPEKFDPYLIMFKELMTI